MKRSSFVIAASAFVLTACMATLEPAPPATTSGLTFIHLNDTYRLGAVEDGNKGGLGRVVTVIRELQAQGRDVRILHGGDFLYPSLESQLWNGEQMVEALNYLDDLAPMHVVVGNHETDRRTSAHLVNAVPASRFDWLGDNYHFETGDARTDSALHSAFVIEHEDKTIGIFALTSHADHGGNDRDYVPTDVDYIGVAKQVIQRFESRGVDLIIGLTHLDLWRDIEVAGLREDHPTFAFIVGGHEHEPKYSKLSDTSAAVMKGASNARVVWKIDVAFDVFGIAQVEGHRLDMDRRVAEDPGYTVLENKWRDRLLDKYPFLEARVGAAAFAMDATEETIRNEETSWGNFIVDQMRKAFGEPAADLAFINSGTLRIDDFIAGDISFEDIGRTFGFSSFLRIMTMSGAEFKQVLEAGYRGAGRSKGYFPQISGFRVCIDRARADGSRIVSLQVPVADGWQEIDADKNYSVVVSDFLYNGGDGYRIPQDRPASRPGSELKYLVLDAIINAQAQGQSIGVPVDPANPRFVELGGNRTQCFP